MANNATSKLDRFVHLAELLGTVSLTDATLDIAAELYAGLSKDGLLIEDDDIFIGAMSLEHNAVLVTNNEKHLCRIADLHVENWSV